MNNLEVIRLLRCKLDYALYCLDKSEESVITSYQQELAESRGVVLTPRLELIYNNDESAQTVRHLCRMLTIYEMKESKK